MSADVSFDRVLSAVADGESIDWEALERLPRDAAERERVQCLRVLAGIGELHRATVDPLADAPEPATAAPPPAPPRAAAPRDTAARAAAPTERRAPRAAADAHTSMSDTIDAASGPSNAPHWGRYRLVEKVGVGGFGQVYRAWDPDLECEVAIKLLHEHIANDRAVDRLRHEGRALAKMRQANVVRVLGVEVHEGRAALCMEFVRGQTLEDLVRSRGSCNGREAAIIGEDVCRALSAVHRAGYLHRDVKAKNVMREQAGRIVLMDFGTGRREQTGREGVNDLTGTPLYMAPEVLEGRQASVRSDVYSVGVLLFYLVTGSHPVQARSTSELKAAHRDGRRRRLNEFRSDLPTSFVRVVDRALAPNPDDRYPNAAALLEALADVINDEPAPLPWPVKWLRRLAIGVPTLTLLVVALGALTSNAFDNTLERTGFADETLLDRTVYGLNSVVAPCVVLLLGWLGLGSLQAVRGLAVSVSPRACAFDERVRARLALFGRNSPQLAAALLLVFAAALFLLWWAFWPLLDATTGSASTRPVRVLAVLSPAYEAYQDRYFQAINLLFIATAAALFFLLRLAARQRRALPSGLVIGFAALLCLELGSRTLSYRLLIKNKEFDPVVVQGLSCFAMGERQDQALVFCPRSEPPRSLLVPKSDVRRDPARRGQSVFTGLEISQGHHRDE